MAAAGGLIARTANSLPWDLLPICLTMSDRQPGEPAFVRKCGWNAHWGSRGIPEQSYQSTDRITGGVSSWQFNVCPVEFTDDSSIPAKERKRRW